MLIVLAGLPGVGKSTIARALAARLGAMWLRIDTIEQALRPALPEVGPAGYVVAYAVAADNLRAGRIVIADSVNPLRITRDAWRDVADAAGVGMRDVEVVCSDAAMHRRRVESRGSEIAGLVLPTWQAVQAREYHDWDRPRLVVDTAALSPDEAVDLIVRRRDATGPR